jgi:hypothetical protein
MNQKFQIFISSTFTDLKEERQACVEAILRAGHIPAGMELFSAGNETQLDTIKRWIEDCEVYILLLGGRYGSIEPKSGLSYTEIEYNYAIQLGKPFFSIIITEDYLDIKVSSKGKEMLELDHPEKYKAFKANVSGKTSRFFSNINDIKLSVLESIIDIQNRYKIKGWVKSNEIPDTTQILGQLSELIERNNKLEQQIKSNVLTERENLGNYSYEELKNILESKVVKVPEKEIPDEDAKAEQSILELFIKYQQIFSIGITDRNGIGKFEVFLIFEVLSVLRIYELAEIVKVPSVSWSKYQTSKIGNRFLALHSLKINQQFFP